MGGCLLCRVRREVGERSIWRHHFRKHAIGRQDSHRAKRMAYVHFSPVKNSLAAAPKEWPYSTFKPCAQRGPCPFKWIGSRIQDVPAGRMKPCVGICLTAISTCAGCCGFHSRLSLPAHQRPSDLSRNILCPGPCQWTDSRALPPLRASIQNRQMGRR
jgi:hypothetical protein